MNVFLGKDNPNFSDAAIFKSSDGEHSMRLRRDVSPGSRVRGLSVSMDFLCEGCHVPFRKSFLFHKGIITEQTTFDTRPYRSFSMYGRGV